MRLLLDTHAFLWLMAEPARLSRRALAACEDPENALYLSAASLWEIQIKQQKGKLRLDVPLDQMLSEQLGAGILRLLPIQAHHVLAVDKLPLHHQDPFDRILMAQAHAEGLWLLSGDQQIRAYEEQVHILW